MRAKTQSTHRQVIVKAKSFSNYYRSEVNGKTKLRFTIVNHSQMSINQTTDWLIDSHLGSNLYGPDAPRP